MNITYRQSVKLTYEQSKEIIEVAFKSQGIGMVVQNKTSSKARIYDVEHQGIYGIYRFRVNIGKPLITVLEVNNNEI